MAFYGRTYTLGSQENHGLHAPVKRWDTNGGSPGPYTKESGFLSYFEFCLEEETWKKEYDPVGKCPFAYKKDQWVGYEDANSLRIKTEWLKANKYGGAMIWALDLDDYRGACGEKNALFNALANGLEGYTVIVPPANQLTTTKKPNQWWSPPTSTTTSRPKTTRYTEPTTASPTTRRTQLAVQTTSSRKPSIVDEATQNSDCPANSSGQLLSSFRPHPTDSSLYLWCINGKDLVLSCPPSTEWNNIEKQCVAMDKQGPPMKPDAAMIEGHSSPMFEAAFFESARIGSHSLEAETGRIKPGEVSLRSERYLNNFINEDAPPQNFIFPPGRPIEWF